MVAATFLSGILVRYQATRRIRPVFLVLSVALYGFYWGGCPCPIHGFQHGILAFTTGNFLQPSILWLLATIVLAWFFGATWCGWVCHLGALQELLYRFNRKRAPISGRAIAAWLWIRRTSVMLFAASLMVVGAAWWEDIDPFRTIFNINTASGAVAVTALALAGISLFVYRPFCRTLCPVGLILGLVGRLPGATGPARGTGCRDCPHCTAACGMGAIIRAGTINRELCIACGDCLDKCNNSGIVWKKTNRGKPVMKNSIYRAGWLGFAIALAAMPSRAAECPSLLKNALQPLTEGSPISWATELTLKGGQHRYEGTNDSFNSEMILGALEFKIAPEHRVYIEGGAKFWDRNDSEEFGASNDDATPGGGQDQRRYGSGDTHVGFREFFYEWAPAQKMLKLGLQEMNAGDPLLMDERVLGGFGKYDISEFRAQAGLGTVSRNFSRMGKFCASRHMYQPLDDYYRDEISNDLLKNNLVFLTLSWLPGLNGGGGEDEFSPVEEKDQWSCSLDEAGVTAFNQFGSGFSNDATYVAAFLRNTLPFQTTLELEAIAQIEDATTRPAYYVKAAKAFDWDRAGLTTLNGGYIFAPGNDEKMRFSPEFANLFLGEALKLDAVHAPLYFGSIFHTISFAWPVYGGITYVSQTEDDKARELDVELGLSPRARWRIGNIPIMEHMLVRLIYSSVESDGLDGQLNTWRLEVRWAI